MSTNGAIQRLRVPPIGTRQPRLGHTSQNSVLDHPCPSRVTIGDNLLVFACPLLNLVFQTEIRGDLPSHTS